GLGSARAGRVLLARAGEVRNSPGMPSWHRLPAGGGHRLEAYATMAFLVACEGDTEHRERRLDDSRPVGPDLDCSRRPLLPPPGSAARVGTLEVRPPAVPAGRCGRETRRRHLGAWLRPWNDS